MEIAKLAWPPKRKRVYIVEARSKRIDQKSFGNFGHNLALIARLASGAEASDHHESAEPRFDVQIDGVVVLHLFPVVAGRSHEIIDQSELGRLHIISRHGIAATTRQP